MTEETTPSQKKVWDTRKIILISIIAIIILSLAGTAFYFYQKYQRVMNDAQAVAQDEASAIVEKVKKFMELPDEQPTIATVTDREKVKDQPFFNRSETGYKVLIYTTAKKAILYRPSANKIIEIVSLSGSTEEKNASPDQNQNADSAREGSREPETDKNAPEPEMVKVVIYNGTQIKGLATKIAEQISDLPNMEIGEKTNAKGNYEKTLVVDFTKKNNGETAKVIAEKLQAEAGDLPVGEVKPEADILVIGASAPEN